MSRNTPKFFKEAPGITYVFYEVVAGYEVEGLVFEGQKIAVTQHKRLTAGDETPHAAVRNGFHMEVGEDISFGKGFCAAGDVKTQGSSGL